MVDPYKRLGLDFFCGFDLFPANVKELTINQKKLFSLDPRAATKSNHFSPHIK